MTKKFALIGAAGYVARKHLDAIHLVGGELVAALDLHDSVGVLDSHFPDCHFFTSPERFDRFLNRNSGGIDYVVICSPNWLHDTHCRWALRSGANAICEKPLALWSRNVDQITALQRETGRTVFPVLQLRLHVGLLALRQAFQEQSIHWSVAVDYVTPRGRWYARSWKADPERSGGLVLNIGVHLFDALQWLFGEPHNVTVYEHAADRVTGKLEFLRATADWKLSLRREDLPVKTVGAHRRIQAEGTEVDLSENFVDLHAAVYRRILESKWMGAEEARGGVALCERIREAAGQ